MMDHAPHALADTPAASPRGSLALPAFLAWPLLAAGLAALVYGAYFFGRQTGTTHIVSAGPRIEDVRRIAKLAVLRVQVADVIEGHNGGGRALVLVKGDADMAIDLDQIRVTERDDTRRSAVLSLPQPRPERPRVDHERTRIYEVEKTGLAALNPFADPRMDLLEDCMRAAQASVEQAVSAPDFATRAQEQAESLLGAYYGEIGWHVTVRWQK